jgi:hypothetical protein
MSHNGKINIRFRSQRKSPMPGEQDASPSEDKTYQNSNEHAAPASGSLRGALSDRTRAAAKTLRKHAKPQELSRDYRHILHMTQEIIYDRAIEKHLFVPSRGRTPLSGLSVESPNKPYGNPYYPVHRLSFEWSMAQLEGPMKDYTFVDYGAGRGRALLLAATYPFKRIKGVEFARELHEDAMMNIAQFPRSLMKCRDVDCLHMDAVDFEIPDGKTVFFFNNPFDAVVMETVLARIVAAYRSNPRRFYLILVRPPQTPTFRGLLEESVIFEPAYHSKSEKLRLRLLSPDQVQIYRSLI